MASRSLGVLTLDLVAKIGGFTGALDKAGRHAKKTTADIAKQAKQIGVALAGAATAGAAAFTAATLKVTNDLSNLRDAASQARIGVETFQAWEYAAGQAGVAAGEFDSAMRRATTTIGKAVEGNDAARKIFARLNVGILDLNGNVRSTEEIVRDYAEAVAGLDNEQQKASASAALFGREAGSKMAVLLDEGNAGLEDMEAKARALGIVLDEKTINAAEEFGDQLDTIKRIFAAGITKEIGKLIPTLSELAQKFIDGKGAMQDFGGAMNALRIQSINDSLAELREKLKTAPDQVGLVDRILYGARSREEIEDEIERLVIALARAEGLDDIGASPPPAPTGGGVVLEPDGDTAKRAKEAAAAIKFMESVVEDNNDAVLEARRNFEEWLTDLDRQAQAVADSLMTEEEAIAASYERRRQIILNSTQYQGEAQTELLRRLEAERDEELLELNGSFWDKYLAAAEENLTSLDELSADLLSNVSQQFGDAVESMLFDSESLSDAVRGIFEDVLRSVVNALGQMAAQWLALQAVQLAIGKSSEAAAIAGATATGSSVAAAYAPAAAMASLASFGANAAPAIAGMAAAAAAAQALSLVGMAHDGIDSVPKTGTWLLEKGERVMTSDTSARLDATLRRLSGGGSGGAIVNIQNAPPGNHRATTRRGADGSTVVDVVLDDIASGGRISQALGGAYGLRRRGS